MLDARSDSEGKQRAAKAGCHERYARGAAAPRVKPAGQHHHVGDQAAERQSQSQQGVDGDKLPETLGGGLGH